ncbi:hypothetical protein Hypma_003734 [Hypsizygus marmoreus]|uniref:Uncharacterized protein n=1 Tax=Hypsizygus marmoreus TaxID=39966 RepID=A0A369J3X0_HYPMA|nr:hypothetical protein Hypma_003734 [Hypsizygus marmoreus]
MLPNSPDVFLSGHSGEIIDEHAPSEFVLAPPPRPLVITIPPIVTAPPAPPSTLLRQDTEHSATDSTTVSDLLARSDTLDSALLDGHPYFDTPRPEDKGKGKAAPRNASPGPSASSIVAEDFLLKLGLSRSPEKRWSFSDHVQTRKEVHALALRSAQAHTQINTRVASLQRDLADGLEAITAQIVGLNATMAEQHGTLGTPLPTISPATASALVTGHNGAMAAVREVQGAMQAFDGRITSIETTLLGLDATIGAIHAAVRTLSDNQVAPSPASEHRLGGLEAASLRTETTLAAILTMLANRQPDVVPVTSAKRGIEQVDGTESHARNVRPHIHTAPVTPILPIAPPAVAVAPPPQFVHPAPPPTVTAPPQGGAVQPPSHQYYVATALPPAHPSNQGAHALAPPPAPAPVLNDPTREVLLGPVAWGRNNMGETRALITTVVPAMRSRLTRNYRARWGPDAFTATCCFDSAADAQAFIAAWSAAPCTPPYDTVTARPNA